MFAKQVQDANGVEVELLAAAQFSKVYGAPWNSNFKLNGKKMISESLQTWWGNSWVIDIDQHPHKSLHIRLGKPFYYCTFSAPVELLSQQ